MLKALTWATAALTATAVHAAEPSTYQQPSAEIRAVLDAPALPGHSLSPDQRTLASVGMRRYRSVAELSRPILRLAGLRIDAAASSPQLTATIESLTLRELANPAAAERVVKLPAGGTFSSLRWSPDSRHFLLNRRTANATELWLGDVATAALRPVKGVRLNTILDNAVAWVSPDEVIVLAVPDRRGAAPVFDAPTGPSIQESMGRNSPERTLQDLLKNSQDDALFSHHASSALRRVKLSTGASREIGAPGLYASIEVVGTQGTLITERLVPPFSYQVTSRARSSCAISTASCCATSAPSSSRKACPSKASSPARATTGPRPRRTARSTGSRPWTAATSATRCRSATS